MIDIQNKSALDINDSIQTSGPVPDQICSNKYTRLNIDLSSVDFFRPDTLVRLKCAIDLAFKHGMDVYINLPNNQDAKSYAGNMGLFDDTIIDGEKFENSTGYDRYSNRHFPLFKIENDRNDKLIERCFLMTRRQNLADNFSEIADNVYFHSGQNQNEGWGYAQAQIYCDYSGSERVEIAVSDVGVGFLGSYERTQQVRGRTEKDIIVDAFEECESSLNNEGELKHRGIGLHGVYEYIKEQSGIIEVWSGQSYVKIGKNEELKVKSLNNKMVGVLFKISL